MQVFQIRDAKYQNCGFPHFQTLVNRIFFTFINRGKINTHIIRTFNKLQFLIPHVFL